MSAHRNLKLPRGPEDEVTENIIEALETAARRFTSSPALRWKRDGRWHTLDWQSYRNQVMLVARGLIRLGFEVGDGLVILSNNRPEWLMADLGATCSHSRPRVSNDNPFSESQFRTLKYQPDYPGRFAGAAQARQWCAEYFDWYNFSHHHSGLAGYTPEQVFTGRYKSIADTRQQALDAQYRQHPERFVNGAPKAALPPTQVLINPIAEGDPDHGVAVVNMPTLPAAGAEKNTLS